MNAQWRGVSGAARRAGVGDQFLLGRGVPEGGPGEARHLLAPVVVGHAYHGHVGDRGYVRPGGLATGRS